METHRSHAVSHLARPLEPTRARASKASIVSLSCPRDVCPSAVSLSCAPPQLNQSCISSLSDSDRLENNFDLIELGGPRLRAPGLGHVAGLSIHRLQEAPHRPGGPRSHFASRPPSARLSCATRAGSSLQRLSASWVALTYATAAFRRVRYASGVSSQGRAGKQRANLYRHQATAVSCSITSCRAPGCKDASSPMNAHKPWSRSACRKPAVMPPVPGWKKPAPRSVKRVVGASQQILLLHLSASAKEAPDRHVRCRGGVLAVQSPLGTYAAEARVCEGGVPASNDM